MPITGFSCFSSGGHFVQQSKIILVIVVEGHSRNIFAENIFKNCALENVHKVFVRFGLVT